MLLLLAVVAAILFAVTSLAVHGYRSKEKRLGQEWFAQGKKWLAAAQPARAVEAFRTALHYDPEAPGFRYGLVESLLAAGQTEQARSYLLNMWEQQPANGTVNLQLGRIAAGRHDITQATHYYHNAIYGIWDDSPQPHRVQARLELARFLLTQDAAREADAELVALAANAPPTLDLTRTLGKLFLQADDFDNASQQFERALQFSPRDAEALGGAGKAAFSQGRYATARHSLERAKAQGKLDPETGHLLEMCNLIVSNDPLDRRVSQGERARRTTQALAKATERVQTCASQAPAAGQGSAADELQPILQGLHDAQKKPRLRALGRDPDLVIKSANLVFAAEEAAAKLCGQPQGLDLALLLIGRSHSEGTR